MHGLSSHPLHLLFIWRGGGAFFNQIVPGSIVVPKRYVQVVIPRTGKDDLRWKNDLCTCNFGFWDEITLDSGWPLVCAQSCLTLCDPMNCSPPGSSVHRIFQARILEWVAISYFTPLPPSFFTSTSQKHTMKEIVSLTCFMKDSP